MTGNLFEKYGGLITFSRLAGNFYVKILDHPDLSPYFSGLNMERILLHMSAFLAEALGGPKNYRGKDLRAAHANLHIPAAHFDAMISLFEQVLHEAAFKQQDIQNIVFLLNSFKDQIVEQD